MKKPKSMRRYIRDTEARRELADAAGTVPAYVYQIATGRRKASPQLARRFDEATGGGVPKHELRPDIFDRPEAAA